MKTKFIEATESSKFNWGKFLVSQFTPEEIAYRSPLDQRPLIYSRGWGPEHLLVHDLQTGEGAFFRIGGLASADLDKTEIWVCPMFEPFLTWLYKQDVSDLDKLPGLVDLGNVATAMHGYRRKGKGRDKEAVA